MSLDPHLPSPAPTPDHAQPAATDGETEQAGLRAEVEQQLLRLSQDLYEMEICAGDVGQGMEGAVPAYMWVFCLSATDVPSHCSYGQGKDQHVVQGLV
jgi:mediator of RNA polymerase II transcription subunit 10